MQCSRCLAEAPDEAHFCQRCGLDVTGGDANRRGSYAAKPDESVVSLKLVSSIMPRGAAARPRTYQYALGVALLAVLVAAASGALPVAVLLAAFAVPLVYIVYLYDVNLWEDEPVLVTGLAFGLTLLVGALWTWLWLGWRGPLRGDGSELSSSASIWGFVIAGLVVPIVGELIRQVGPVVLASRPEFDDLMDGLTFGVISGVGYATADTLIKHWPLITGGYAGTDGWATWTSLLVLEGFIKPLVMGTATGIACAEFSGLGKGYDGFTGRYYRGVLDAIGANLLFGGGLYLLKFLNEPLSLILSIVWGLAILAFLIIRVRTVLHRGLMEAAMEASSREAGATTDDMGFCPVCEMPLLPGAAFCSACGVSVRAAGRVAHATTTEGGDQA